MSVIIPAFDAAATLGQCLDALTRQGVPGPRAELLVVDDASSDATAEIARRAGVHVLLGTGRGPAAARNLGARQAVGEVLVFLDADTAPEEGWLEELLRPLADPRVVAVKGAYRTCQRRLVARFVQLEFEHKYARLARSRRVDFVDTGAAAFRREAFLAAGGFDEAFPANSAEDVELAFRLAEQGSRLAFAPAARVRHRHPDRLSVYLAKKLRYGFFRTSVYERHPSKALGDSYTPPVMALQIALAGLLSLLSVAALLGRRRARTGLAACLLAFLATTLPLSARALRTDASLAPITPALVFARAFAQGLGIAAALARKAALARSRVDGEPERA